MQLKAVHHIAIICKDYAKSKVFYTEALNLKIIAEVYRKERDSWKLDLALGDTYAIELFSFPNPPERVSRPEACGLRHLAFSTTDIEKAHAHIKKYSHYTEEIRVDEYTDKKFFFFFDPDNLPLEIYEL